MIEFCWVGVVLRHSKTYWPLIVATGDRQEARRLAAAYMRDELSIQCSVRDIKMEDVYLFHMSPGTVAQA